MQTISVTFCHEVETIKGLRDFEQLIIQANENRLNSIIKRFDTGSKSISNVSSIKIYQHEGAKLTKKAKLIHHLPITLEREKHFLNSIINQSN